MDVKQQTFKMIISEMQKLHIECKISVQLRLKKAFIYIWPISYFLYYLRSLLLLILSIFTYSILIICCRFGNNPLDFHVHQSHPMQN